LCYGVILFHDLIFNYKYDRIMHTSLSIKDANFFIDYFFVEILDKQ